MCHAFWVKMTALLAAVLGCMVLSACASDAREASTVIVSDVEAPAALAALPDGGFAYGQRLTGTVVAVDSDGRSPRTIIELEVSTRGQQGLLGIASRPDTDEIYAAWTTLSEQLVVGRIDTGVVEVVWSGFAASDGANGGRLAFLPNGRLVIGVGTVRNSSLVADPESVNGKMLSLDPAGPPEQTPVVLSGGWNNPFAFAVTPAGNVWVADNDPGAGAERLARGDLGAEVALDLDLVTELPLITAPAGMVAISDAELWVCGYISEALLRYRVNDDGLAERSGTVSTDCQLDVVQLTGGAVVFSTETDIRTIDP